MSSQTKVIPTTVSNPSKPVKKKSSYEKLKREKLRRELDKMRKSKEFRALGDMLYLD
tara:strand:- start:45 stop:215 length:171 start_codon:yes stop_codon:yes gene_type:complete